MAGPRLQHVHVCYEPGREAEARAFYSGVLGLPETGLRRPPFADGRPRALWFDAGGGNQVHVSADPDRDPHARRHFALVVDALAPILDRARAAGSTIQPFGREPRQDRCYALDPFGNRIELIEETALAESL